MLCDIFFLQGWLTLCITFYEAAYAHLSTRLAYAYHYTSRVDGEASWLAPQAEIEYASGFRLISLCSTN